MAATHWAQLEEHGAGPPLLKYVSINWARFFYLLVTETKFNLD